MVFHNISYTFKKITLIFLCAFIFHDLPARQHQDHPVPGTYTDSTGEASAEGEGDDAITADSSSTTTREKSTSRAVPDSVIENLKREKEFEYANDSAYWNQKELNAGNDFRISMPGLGIFSMMLWIAVIALLLYIFYWVVLKNKLYLFYSSSPNKKHETDISETADENLDDKIRKAVDTADYRAAVRYMYLKSLKMLNEKGWIKFTAQGSNADYINAVNKYPSGESFRHLTRSYEYVWYGGFSLNEDRFGFISRQFEQFYKSLNTYSHSIKNNH